MKARNPFLLLIVMVLVALADGAAAPLPSACGPSFSEIYDFQVGDVFEYGGFSTSAGNHVSSDEKYTVLSKEASDRGFRYGVAGLSRYSSDQGLVYKRTAESWDFTDSSARKILDACEDRLVPFPRSGTRVFSIPSSIVSQYYTRIRIWPGDTLDFRVPGGPARLKILGGLEDRPPSGNLYRDSAGTLEVGGQFLSAYAAGLGMVRAKYNLGEQTGDIQLTGYIRNGIVHGAVSPDSAFGNHLSIRAASSRNRDSHGGLPMAGNRSFMVRMAGSVWSDLLGRKTRSGPASRDQASEAK